MKRSNPIKICLAALLLGLMTASVLAQLTEARAAHSRFIDPMNGMTADDLVKRALEQNGELQAARLMIAEARGRWRQAGLKANPMIEVSGKQAVTSPDNNQMIGIELPLELKGRRRARVDVATREIEMREAEVHDFERKLAAEVRMKYA
ncbi:MAG: TolC family protein, partial [Acidobacteriota bacterium]|nr:TolC family protein [Acidobacteriota bacterium]